MEIRLVESNDEILRIYPVLKQLRPQYSEDNFVHFVQTELFPRGVRLAQLSDDGQLVCAAGFRISASLAWGKFVYIDDLVSLETNRSKGYGKAMLDWIAAYGKSQGCHELHLDSGVQRHEAHRFYLRERMDIVFYHFKKVLS
ncbi:GNAT family N-acetyltransferase [Caldimonas brevitalea]|uniref:Histone acetyltransferase HPA2 n=1 Tax=Caldimonas brevitalea TaxID=413882 RepID=A0A0G3BNV3_9BURK|nr:GNAT family N-acetyltransferase [Caldimonas brevitalea]AKJ29031.1 histone acetyltransferase HPA2 [Caldimonas brevitalea]